MPAGGAAFNDLDDIIELGFEGFDLIADKGIDRMPSEALHRDYYHPRRLRQSLAGGSDKSIAPGKTEPERRPTRTRTRSASPSSRVRMRSRDRYDDDYRGGFERAIAPAAAGPLVMYTPRDEQVDERRQPDWMTSSTESLPGSVIDYPREAAAPRRYPRPLPLRRTSSLDDCADRAAHRYSGGASSPSSSGAPRRQRRDSEGKRLDKRPAHQQFFSQTSKGLAGGAIGAVVGGLVARQAVGLLGARAPGEEGIDSNGGRLAKQSEKLGLQGEDRRGKRVKDPHWAVTLLGAAVAGLGVNALVEKKEESEREKKAAMMSRRESCSASRAREHTSSCGSGGGSSSGSHSGSGLEAARTRVHRLDRARWAGNDVESRSSMELADDEYVYYDVRRVERY